MTPLHYTAIYGRKTVVKLLLKKGAKVTATDKVGWTPMHLAALSGYKTVAELLLKNSVDANATGIKAC